VKVAAPKLRVLVLLALLGLTAVAVRRSSAAGFYIIIVNSANPVSSLSATEVSRMFLKKATRWPQGDPVQPVDLKEGAVRESFSREIHDRATSAVKSYWQQALFSGSAVPPPEVASGAEVVAHVRAHRGGIGYVSARTDLGDGVKAIKVQ
jgi:ABC-type phosphate transport system substrate-binding protein